MDNQLNTRIIKDNFSTSHTVEFCSSSNGAASVFLTHYSSKVHVMLSGPLNDRLHARHDRASITVLISHDEGSPTAGAAGKLSTVFTKRRQTQDDSLLAERVRNAFMSVIDHSAYKRCTFSFAVHVLHCGENFLATVLCACMMALLSAGVECVTTLVPQSVVLVTNSAESGNSANDVNVLVNPSEKHLSDLSEGFSMENKELVVHHATIAHNITGDQLLAFVFDASPHGYIEALTQGAAVALAEAPQETQAVLRSVSLFDKVCRNEIASFVQWAKSSYSHQRLQVLSQCIKSQEETQAVANDADES